MEVYCDDERIENNCTLCKFFKSYASDYFDKNEPADQGFCEKDQNNNYGDATITCNLFEVRV